MTGIDPEALEASTSELVVVMAQTAELIAPIREAAEGYRAQLERDGWGSANAAAMGADFHRLVTAMFVTAFSGAASTQPDADASS